MKKILLILAAMLFVMASCKKDWDDWGCNCKSPYPITQEENVPEISWTDYNSVRDACFHFERIVNTEDVALGKILDSPCYEHIGDTLRVYGWLYNSENTNVDKPGDWIANEERYASGMEKYPPWTGVGGGFGQGIELTNLHISDSSLIKNKCFLTGIIGFTTFYEETGDPDTPCQHLRLKLNVLDIYFEEDKK